MNEKMIETTLNGLVITANEMFNMYRSDRSDCYIEGIFNIKKVYNDICGIYDVYNRSLFSDMKVTEADIEMMNDIMA